MDLSLSGGGSSESREPPWLRPWVMFIAELANIVGEKNVMIDFLYGLLAHANYLSTSCCHVAVQ